MDRHATREHAEAITLQAQASLPMWVVYRPVTREYPGKWVARLFLCLPVDTPTTIVMVRDSLSELRDALPRGMTLLRRDPNDVPEIEEVWF